MRQRIVMPQPTTKRARNFNRQGYSVDMSGYVTTLLSVTNRSSDELERTLGFGAGRLQSGWALYFLVQGVSIHEFVHQGTTRYSGGLAYDRDATELLRAAGMIDGRRGETMQVRRVDQMRYAMWRDSGSPEDSEEVFDLYRAHEVATLNRRSGPQRIVKCVPVAPGSEFPNARWNGVPQWELMVLKQFHCAAVLGPGQRYLGGGAPHIG